MNGAFRSMFYASAVILLAAASTAASQPGFEDERWVFGNGPSGPSAWVTGSVGSNGRAILSVRCGLSGPSAELTAEAGNESLGDNLSVQTYQFNTLTDEFSIDGSGMGETLSDQALTSLRQAEFIRVSGGPRSMFFSARGSAAAIRQLIDACANLRM